MRPTRKGSMRQWWGARPRERRPTKSGSRGRSPHPRRGRDLTSLLKFYTIHFMGNTFGQLFRITTWGESHGGGVGVVIDGCPPRLKLTEGAIQPDLERRRPG